MTNARKKDEALSETAKTYLQEIYIKEVWGREKSDMVGNRYTQKGIMCETDSLELIEKVTGKKYFKNQKTLENEWIVGTPDVTGQDLVDIKTSFDLWTFSKTDEKQAIQDYYYQMLGYMNLLNKTTAVIAYCLVNTPEIIITDELYRLSFKLPEDQIDQYRKNYIFDDIPEKMRIKMFDVSYNEEDYQKVKEKILFSREYLNTLSL